MNAPSPTSTASKPLIARVWHGATPAEMADAYADYLSRTGVPDLRGTAGNRGVFVFRRVQDQRAEFQVISLWDSFDAIRGFAGDDYEKARYYPADREYLLDIEPYVLHYEVIKTP